MFSSQLPLGSEFLKFFTSSDQDSEYREIANDIVAYMASNYYGLKEAPSFHLRNGTTTNKKVTFLQTLIIDSDILSDVWLLQVCKDSLAPHVRFYISSSNRISKKTPAYQLDTLMANGFIANNIADIACGFDRSSKINIKDRGYNIFSWLLPSECVYGKEKYVYAKLNGFDTFQKSNSLSTNLTSASNIFQLLDVPSLSEEIVKIEEGAVNDFLLKKNRFIYDHLGRNQVSEILTNLGLDPRFLSR
jgi:hypothetical protein